MTPRGDQKRPNITPRWLQDGLVAMFFLHRFVHLFFVGLGFDVGSLWAPFWEPKSVIFGIELLMIF